eukprot:scaffold2570_cov72-Phaeocystis_antarctica.AAC.4
MCAVLLARGRILWAHVEHERVGPLEQLRRVRFEDAPARRVALQCRVQPAGQAEPRSRRQLRRVLAGAVA